jgi:hypothetical protein
MVLAASLAIWLGNEDFGGNVSDGAAIKVKQDGPRAQLPGMAPTHDPKAEWNRRLPHQARSEVMDLGSFFAAARRERRHRFYGR